MLKVGDVVIISQEIGKRTFSIYDNGQMAAFAGSITRIRKVEDRLFRGHQLLRLDIDASAGNNGGGWLWTDEMVEQCCVEEESPLEESDRPINYLFT